MAARAVIQIVQRIRGFWAAGCVDTYRVRPATNSRVNSAMSE